MEEKREYADVDEYIFAEQEWQPSEKQDSGGGVKRYVTSRFKFCGKNASFLFTDGTFSDIIDRIVLKEGDFSL